MSISIEPAPASLTIEAREYFQRMLIQIAGSFEEMESQIADLQNRVNELENP